MAGRIAPTRLDLIGPSVIVIRNVDGTMALGLSGPDGSALPLDPTGLLSAGGQPGPWSALRRIGIHRASPASGRPLARPRMDRTGRHGLDNPKPRRASRRVRPGSADWRGQGSPQRHRTPRPRHRDARHRGRARRGAARSPRRRDRARDPRDGGPARYCAAAEGHGARADRRQGRAGSRWFRNCRRAGHGDPSGARDPPIRRPQRTRGRDVRGRRGTAHRRSVGSRYRRAASVARGQYRRHRRRRPRIGARAPQGPELAGPPPVLAQGRCRRRAGLDHREPRPRQDPRPPGRVRGPHAGRSVRTQIGERQGHARPVRCAGPPPAAAGADRRYRSLGRDRPRQSRDRRGARLPARARARERPGRDHRPVLGRAGTVRRGGLARPDPQRAGGHRPSALRLCRLARPGSRARRRPGCDSDFRQVSRDRLARLRRCRDRRHGPARRACGAGCVSRPRP